MRELSDEERWEILRRYGIEPDPVIEFYKKKNDRAALRENLRLTPQERGQKFLAQAKERDASQREQEASERNS
jgi:hypothetical protein